MMLSKHVFLSGLNRCVLLLVSLLYLSSCTVENTMASPPLPASDNNADTPYSQFVFRINAERYNLGQGEFLVALLNTTCEHCRDSVPLLNEYTYVDEWPRVIGLMQGDEATHVQFKASTNPEFPTFLIDSMDFFGLIASAPPRLAYIRNGVLIKAWDEEFPTLDFFIEEQIFSSEFSH